MVRLPTGDCTHDGPRGPVALGLRPPPTVPPVRVVNTYHLYWAPEGKRIATVKARDERAAIRKAPKPYRNFLGEVYAERV